VPGLARYDRVCVFHGSLGSCVLSPARSNDLGEIGSDSIFDGILAESC
jgi:hypothetical protein